MYTPGQIAKQLQIDTSTLRRWARLFHTYLSPTAGPGNPRQYTKNDFVILQHIKQLFAEGYTVATAQELFERFREEGQPPYTTVTPPSPSLIPHEPSNQQVIVRDEHRPEIDALNRLLEEYQRVVRQQEQQIADQQVLIDQLQQDMTHMRAQVRTIRLEADTAHAAAEQAQAERQRAKDDLKKLGDCYDDLLDKAQAKMNRVPGWLRTLLWI